MLFRCVRKRGFVSFLSRNMATFKTLGTHNGVFHCDEVLGCHMLKLLNPGLTIVRSRDYEALDKCDVVIDVGGVYDPPRNRFDHHQRGFAESMSTVVPGKPWTTKLSSAGLVFCHFGKSIIKKIVEDIDDVALESVYDRVYEGFVREIDAIDNGIPIAEGELNYRITTNLSSRVSHMNRSWNQTDFNEQEAFDNAVEYVGKEFDDRVRHAARVWWPGRRIVREAIEKKLDVHPSGEIIAFDVFCPWEDHFFQLEKELGVEPLIKFLVFPDQTGSWRVRAVPVASGDFVLRVPLHESWRGLNNERGDQLAQASGIEGTIFVHASGFIGGNKTRDGAIQMAFKSIELSKGNCSLI